MRALYEIENEILECVDEETGEILDEEKLNALEMEREKKIEAVILWRKDLRAEAEAVKAEGAKLYKRGKSCENLANRLDVYIEKVLDGNKFKTDRCSVSYRKTKSIVIDEPTIIESRFFKPISEDWISKIALKEAFDKGEPIFGAHQEEKQSLIIK